MSISLYDDRIEVKYCEFELVDSANDGATIDDFVSRAGCGLYGHGEVGGYFTIIFRFRGESMSYEGPEGSWIHRGNVIDLENPEFGNHEAKTYYGDQDGGEHLMDYDLSDEEYEEARRQALQDAYKELRKAGYI